MKMNVRNLLLVKRNTLAAWPHAHMTAGAGKAAPLNHDAAVTQIQKTADCGC